MEKEDDTPKEEVDKAILNALLEIQTVLHTMAEFQEQLAEAFEMLAKQLGYEFPVTEDAKA